MSSQANLKACPTEMEDKEVKKYKTWTISGEIQERCEITRLVSMFSNQDKEQKTLDIEFSG